MPVYVPRKGDLIAISLDPQSGNKQRGRRPVLVISNDLFNRHTGLCVACPITSTCRNYPFHVPIPDGLAVTGFVMVEQVGSVDFGARKAKRIGEAPAKVLEETLSILDAMIY